MSLIKNNNKKQTFYFIITITIAFIACVFFTFFKYKFSFATLFIIVLAAAACGGLANIDSSIRSFYYPLKITIEDVGRFVRISNIKEGRVGLVDYGFNGFSAIGDKSVRKWYYAKIFPEQILNVDTVLKIESSDNGLVFKKVKVNGWVEKINGYAGDQNKEPLEILNEEFAVLTD